jgi:complement component 1 Q subcomponent-binding protein
MAFRAFNLLRAARPVLRPTVLTRSTQLLTGRTTLQRSPLVAATRALSYTAPRFGQGLVDRDLAHQLDLELKYERDETDEAEPDFLKSFRAQNKFQIHDKPGYDEVTLTRAFGDEKITITFSVADINNAEEEHGVDQELDALEKELQNEESDIKEEDLDEEGPAIFPVNCNIVIEKEGKGALSFDVVCDSGEFLISGILYCEEGIKATSKTVDEAWKRRELYSGPQFGHLDEDLQVLFERYLEERDINTALAMFIPSYIEYKEQRDYIGWLENVKKFVEG